MLEKQAKRGKTLLLSILCTFLLVSCITMPAQAFSPQVIQRGATGDDVIELQARLQYIGYYTGNIDGVFGWGTYWAVRNFQHDFGLTIDGLVGDEVKAKLRERTHFDKQYVYGKLEQGKVPKTYGPDPGKRDGRPPGQRDPGNLGQRQAPAPGAPAPGAPAPGAPAPEAPEPGAPAPEAPAPDAPQQDVGQAEPGVNLPDGFTANDLKLMANAVYGEARGEPYEGQVAVAAVILNRIKDSRFPNTVSGVIFEPLAFTAVADGQIWLEPNDTARRAVQDAINGWDPTNGLVYYYNPQTATSQWMFNRTPVKYIGKHLFVH